MRNPRIPRPLYIENNPNPLAFKEEENGVDVTQMHRLAVPSLTKDLVVHHSRKLYQNQSYPVPKNSCFYLPQYKQQLDLHTNASRV